jgi:thymidylate synthase ThyX
VSFEDISILATKEIEDRRIGGSPIEQSTRYVFYDQRNAAGEFRYVRDPDVMVSRHAQSYVETMDFIFQTYCDLIEPMKAFYMGLKPIEAAEYDVAGTGTKQKLADLADEKQRKAFRVTYNADIRTKACDTLRYLLPIATKTNVGVFGNGRYFQNVLSHCMSHRLPEVRRIAADARAALDQVIPHYVKRAKPNEYLRKVDAATDALAARLFKGIAPAAGATVDLLDHGEDAIAEQADRTGVPGDVSALRRAMADEKDALTIACMLFPYLSHPLRQIRQTVRGMDAETRREIIATSIGDRQTRRDRPGRALESGYPYTFDMLTDFGTYKDLERHRMSSQIRQRFTPTIGFQMPPDLVEAGYEDRAKACVERAVALYERLAPDFPDAASYATLHGSLVRWVLAMNDRPLMHMIELRTQPAGHPSYRKVCQLMHRAVTARSAWRGEAMKFADHGDYFWSRADSEARQRVKEKALEERKG